MLTSTEIINFYNPFPDVEDGLVINECLRLQEILTREEYELLMLDIKNIYRYYCFLQVALRSFDGVFLKKTTRKLDEKIRTFRADRDCDYEERISDFYNQIKFKDLFQFFKGFGGFRPDWSRTAEMVFTQSRWFNHFMMEGITDYLKEDIFIPVIDDYDHPYYDVLFNLPEKRVQDLEKTYAKNQDDFIEIEQEWDFKGVLWIK